LTMDVLPFVKENQVLGDDIRRRFASIFKTVEFVPEGSFAPIATPKNCPTFRVSLPSIRSTWKMRQEGLPFSPW